MQCAYLLVLSILLGVDGRKSFNESPANDDAIFVGPVFKTDGAVSSSVDDFALDSKQISKLEVILNDLMSKYLGPPPTKLSLRTNRNGTAGLIKTVRIIGNAIRKSIRSLCDKLGLPQPNRPKPSADYNMGKSTSLKVAIYYEIMRFPLEMAPIVQSVKAQINKHLQRNNYTHMGYKSVKFELQSNQGNSTEEWKFLAVFSAIGIYGTNFYNCLDEKKPNSFDLKRAVRYLTNHPAESAGKILRSRLIKRVPRHPGLKRAEYNQFHAFACHAAANDSRLDYRDCLVEMKRVDNCVQAKLNDSSTNEDFVTKSSKDFIQEIKRLGDDCTTRDRESNVSLICMLKKEDTKSHEFTYIIDFFMGDLKKSPGLERMAKDLGATLKKSQMGSEVVNEVAALVEMYKHGLQKKEQLLKFARKDVNQRYRYNRMSDHLERYRQYCVDFAKRTVGHLHRAMSSVEKVFVDPSLGIARENLTENARAMKCLSSFVESVFGSWSHRPGQFPTTPDSVHQNTNPDEFKNPPKRHRLTGLIKVPNKVGFVRSSHEESLNKLMESMKRLSQSRPPRRTTALITLANTFLLATVFYESIAIIAAAIYRQDSDAMSQSTSAENVEPDPWPPRDRRSPPSVIDKEDVPMLEKQDEGGSLSLTNRSEEINDSPTHPNPEGIQGSVGNSSNEEATVDSIELTTISNNLIS